MFKENITKERFIYDSEWWLVVQLVTLSHLESITILNLNQSPNSNSGLVPVDKKSGYVIKASVEGITGTVLSSGLVKMVGNCTFSEFCKILSFCSVWSRLHMVRNLQNLHP